MEDFAFLDDPFHVDGIGLGEVAHAYGGAQSVDALGTQSYGGLSQNKGHVSKTALQHTRPAGFIQGFTDPFENQGSLEDEWMDLSSLLPDLEATTTTEATSILEPIPRLGLETLDFLSTLPTTAEQPLLRTTAEQPLLRTREPQTKSVSFLERLLLQQNNLLGQKVKFESSDSLWKWLSEQKDKNDSITAGESSSLLSKLHEQNGEEDQITAALPCAMGYQSPEQEGSPCDLSVEEDEGSDVDADVLLAGDELELVRTPEATDDIESRLSSVVSSPSVSGSSDKVSASCSTLCLKSVASDNQSSPSSSSNSQTSTNTRRTRSRSRRQSPSVDKMPSPLDLELMNKTDRKKLQNKMAAIKYRMRKKVETCQKKTEVGELESINKKLMEKVEKLSKEVTYMKNFFNDVRKARGLPTVKF